jgi:hypothetical protein
MVRRTGGGGGVGCGAVTEAFFVESEDWGFAAAFNESVDCCETVPDALSGLADTVAGAEE